MISIIVKKEEWEEIEKLIPEIFPELHFELVVEDISLKILGLAESVPCVVSIDTDFSGYESILDELSQLETDAYLNDDYEDSPEYYRYERYKNLWPILFNAINNHRAGN